MELENPCKDSWAVHEQIYATGLSISRPHLTTNNSCCFPWKTDNNTFFPMTNQLTFHKNFLISDMISGTGITVLGESRQFHAKYIPQKVLKHALWEPEWRDNRSQSHGTNHHRGRYHSVSLYQESFARVQTKVTTYCYSNTVLSGRSVKTLTKDISSLFKVAQHSQMLFGLLRTFAPIVSAHPYCARNSHATSCIERAR